MSHLRSFRFPVAFAAFAALVAVTLLAAPSSASIPTQVSYQGELLRDGAPFAGTAQMKFVVFDEDNSIWSNDGTSVEGSQPTASISVPVESGVFSVLLGGTGMVPLTSTVFAGAAAPQLRIWVDTGSGFEQLPDQPIVSGAYALSAQSAERSEFDFRANGVIWSMAGGFKFPDGSVQTTASFGGGGGGGTLDQAYDFGGPGLGRTITADAGAVNVAGADGLRVNGSLAVGTTAASPYARLTVNNVGGADNVKLLAFDEGIGGEFHFEGDFAGANETGNKLSLNSAWVSGMTSWRGDGHVGFGIDPTNARIAVFHSGTTNGSPGMLVANANVGDAYGLVVTATGTGPAATFSSTSGDVVRFLDGGGGTMGRIANNGRGHFPSLQNLTGTTVLDTSGRWRSTGAFGGGVVGAPYYAENTTSNGNAFWGKVTSTDATAVLEQNGSGSLLEAFKSGVLKFEVTNTGRVVTTALQITGGGDLAEPFDLSDLNEVRPGLVLTIDAAKPGHLRVCDRAYDPRVAGVVSGAGGIRPGITLDPYNEDLESTDVGASARAQVALTGRVYVWADATHGAIEPGDLLTTSDTPGHAQRASDRERAAGAILGKAMSSLDSGRGLVLALVSLQ